MQGPTPETAANETAAERCPYCGRPFPSTHLHALHLGEAHPGDCTAAERDAYEDARDAETDELFVFHLKVIAAIGAMWAVFVLAYMVVLGG